MAKPTLKKLKLPPDPRPNFSPDYLKRKEREAAQERRNAYLADFRREHG